ncbi:Uncharacterized protein OBRU01_00994 [Operophtera brumata]|uniref:Uncharacterized protein n=1 Tax=Operophtera brumata TaxID=104452 RepID=A0A0L7LUL1_OPEBR|nr:Uncharacterized protein OBRU01_00994 [Operophtera brumata]
MNSSDSESDEYDVCYRRSNSCALLFNPTSLENIILTLSDKFDVRVILSSERARGALLVTTGLTLAGGMLGRHYGGKIGAAVGGAIGGVCGLGFVAVSMRDIWEDIKSKLSELFDIVYDYLAGLGLDDYRKAATFLTNNSEDSQQLAMIIMETASALLGKKILSSITTAY